jgi:uncharacterized DUF497 family protein
MATNPDALLAACEGFEWDTGNAAKLRSRHDVEPAECEQLFMQVPLLISADEAHSQGEMRWRVLGETADARPLFLVFTIRSKLIRVLQARPMNRKERRVYAEANERT